ncbi:MAG TPA: hypothetical protein ENK57_19085, partial [Polyangiaceae bacterium]|nr:hypothetical protein [Polyangiaceae bacterium]
MRRWIRSGLALMVPLVLGRCGGIPTADPPADVRDDDGAGGDPASSSSSAGARAAGGGGPEPIDVCSRCVDQTPQPLGLLPEALNEISGLAPSAIHEGMYWAHNDSGDVPRLFLLDADGTLSGEYALSNA